MSESSINFPQQAVTGSSANNVIFLDVNINYTLDQNQITVANAGAINVKILNLIFTALGSRPFEPDFGLDLDLLFTNIVPNGVNAYKAKTKIYIALKKWMSQYITISPSGVQVIAAPIYTAYFIIITYAIIGSSVPQTLGLRYNQ